MKVIIESYHPVGSYPKMRQGWADVTVRWRRSNTHEFSNVCIEGLNEAMGDYEMTATCQKENPHLDYSQDLRDEEEVLRELGQNPVFVRDDRDPEHMPNVYLRSQSFARAGAEKAIRAWLKTRDVHDPVFVWKARQVLVWPITIGPKKT